MTTLKRFLGSLFSRKAVAYGINKIFAFKLAWSLSDPIYITGVFVVSSIFDLALLSIISFEKIKTNIEIGK